MESPVLFCPACRGRYSVRPVLFGCPQARPGKEHTLRRVLPACARRGSEIRSAWAGGAPGSFDALRHLSTGYHLLGQDGYRALVARLTSALRRDEGRGFEVTPLAEHGLLAAVLGRGGRLWVKDETGNVTGSHKGRHLMGTLLYLEALRGLEGRDAKEVLAIYSCGNAALGAAAVARAGGYELHAFVPSDVDPAVAAMLAERGAVVERVPRGATGEGDPCYIAFQKAVHGKGWLPFACAGNDNWSNIEGGATLGWEMLLQLAERGERIEHLVVQVGGGALARAAAQAFSEARGFRVIDAVPRLHVCQPEGGFPFVRAYILALAEIARAGRLPFDLRYDRDAEPAGELDRVAAFARGRQDQVRAAAEHARRNFESQQIQALLERLAAEPGRVMWPWDGPAPHSLAHGILDDVTYDWYDLLRALLQTGGAAAILDEETIKTAHDLARRRTGIPVCPTGASGLAGLIQLQASGVVGRDEAVGLLFTGIDRAGGE